MTFLNTLVCIHKAAALKSNIHFSQGMAKADRLHTNSLQMVLYNVRHLPVVKKIDLLENYNIFYFRKFLSLKRVLKRCDYLN